MKIKALFTVLAASIVVLGTGPADLSGQSADILDSEIPEPSGGSWIGSSQSSEGALLGPDSFLGVTLESEPVFTEDVTISATFEGFGFDDNPTENGGFLFVPPDPNGAAGGDRVIAVVNTMIEARTKAGGLLWRDSLADFFTPLAPTTFTFDPKVIYDMPGSVRQQYETFKAEFMQNPAIVGVTASNSRLGSFLSETGIRFEGADPDENWNVPYNGVDYDFIPFYGLELVEGRNFSREIASDTSDAGGYVINEALMRKLGWTTAVGKPFSLGGGDELGTVVGVVKDFHFYSLHHKIEPLVLFVWPGRLNHLYARIRPENMTETLAFIEDQWEKRAPDRPFEYVFLDDRFAQLYQSEARIGKVFGTFSLLAIVIACLGLFGLVAFTAEQRTKEIGMRKVLGASVVNIVLLLSKDFTKLVGLAILIATPIAYVAMQRWLENFAYRIEISWGLLLAAGLLAILVAWLTVSYQSIKAALTDPVKALRHE